jgi:hypothetical protein
MILGGTGLGAILKITLEQRKGSNPMSPLSSSSLNDGGMNMS